jgi:hypothetical protein
MSLIQSPQQLDTPWRDLLLAAGVAVALPAGLGVIGLGLHRLMGNTLSETVGLPLWIVATAMMLSPFLSLPAMILTLPVSSLLVRLGWFGWLPSATTGLVIGGLIGAMMGVAAAAPAGAFVLLILRATLGLLRPMTVAP